MPEIVLHTDQPFRLDLTLSCGQVFGWVQEDGWWYGLVEGVPLRIRQEKERLIFEGAPERTVRSYLHLDLDLEAVLQTLRTDPLMESAIERCCGLRIVQQPAWDCLAAYICSTCSNIPMIERRIANLSRRFGEEVEAFGRTFYTFPGAERLAGEDEPLLRECKLGYRASYIRETAEAVAADPGWAARIDALPCESARRELMRYAGIGPKAADCILLFAFGRYESFPVDVWIHRIMQRFMPDLPERPICTADYERIRQFARNYFGDYAGYAQEYLYCLRREIGGDLPDAKVSGTSRLK